MLDAEGDAKTGEKVLAGAEAAAHNEGQHAQDGQSGEDDFLMLAKYAKGTGSHCASSRYGHGWSRPNPARA